ncbi:MAG: response regulator [bacterium]
MDSKFNKSINGRELDGCDSPAQQFQQLKMESLELMASGLAHDFNNLLLAIMGNADLLAQDLTPNNPSLALVDEIRTSAGRAAEICNKLLAFAGKGRLHFQFVDLAEVTRSMVQMLKVAVSRQITLRLDLDDSLPLIQADLTQIHQVIMNLVVNASEAIAQREGVITLASGRMDCPPGDFGFCALLPDRPDGKFVFLEVTDNGPGIPPDALGRIFDPFYSSKLQGRGLGLASVLGAVRSHNGGLCVRSDPGKGATFRVCLPLQRRMNGQQARPAQPRVRVEGGTILVVEDEATLRNLCSRMLSRLGYDPLVAGDGPQGIELFTRKHEEITCVILDLIMPGMNGLEVLDRIQSLKPGTRVIMTSGYHEQEIARRFADRGLAGFIQKPYVMADLARVLSEVVGEVTPAEEPDPES